MFSVRHCLSALLLCVAVQLTAQNYVRVQKDEQVYRDQLAAVDASVVPYFDSGTIAMDQGSFIDGGHWFYLVKEKVPRHAATLRRYAWCDVKIGNVDSAIRYAKRAYYLDHSWESALMLVNVYAATGSTMYYHQGMEFLDQCTTQVDKVNEWERMITSIQCANDYGDLVRLDREMRQGLVNFPDSMAPHYYAAALSIYYQDWISADKELRRAEELGLSPEAAAELRESGLEEELTFELWKHRIWWSFIWWAIGLAALFIFGMVLSYFTLSKVESQIMGGGPLRTDGLRKLYRRVVNIAGIYYYLSLPFVLMLCLIAVGGTIYLFGKIPIYFFFLILASGGITIFFMIKTLIIRPKAEESGRVLKEEEAPALFALSREVAQDMNTRPVEEIRITPHVDMAVYERGKWRDKMNDRATRVLIMGAGILQKFKVDDFRAILAHEYGHFASRDTAGGSVAFRVRRDIHHYAYSLAVNGQARWWNLAYQFLRLYDFIFRRISHGATRLQEILADRVAAELYGAKTFENGLMHVIVQDIEFNVIAGNKIADCKNARASFPNLYELPYGYQNKIEDGVKEYMAKKTTKDDTHPCPADRFRYIAGIRGAKSHNSEKLVTELFRDWKSITEEQTKAIEEEWKGHPAPGM